MKNKTLLLTVLILVGVCSFSAHLQAQAFISAESGAVFTQYNDVRVSGKTGAYFL